MKNSSSAATLRGHIPALDGLRGLAVLMVFTFHAIQVGDPRTLPDWLIGTVSAYGWAGVDLFFVLSGFLITGILWDAKGASGYLRVFYARRILRIFPLYYGACLLYLVIVPWFSGSVTPSVGAWYWTHTTNFLVALNGTWEASVHGTAHFWSLAVEEQFYLIWPVLVMRLDRRRLLRVCAVAIVAAIAIRTVLVTSGSPFAAYVLLPARMDGLAVGALLALWVRGPAGPQIVAERMRIPAILGALGLAAIVLGTRYAGWDGPWMLTLGVSANVVLFGGVLVNAAFPAGRGVLSRIFSSASLRFLGRYSYGLYVLGGLGAKVVQRLWPHSTVDLSIGARLGFAGLDLLVAIGIALFSWHAYEKHFLRLKSLFRYGRRQEVAEPAPVVFPA